MRFVTMLLQRLNAHGRASAIIVAANLAWCTPSNAEQKTANYWTQAAAYSACPVAPLDWFTQAEAWAWEQVCLDRAAYMRAVPEDDPRFECRVRPEDASPFGDALSPRFLVVVNTQEPFISHLPAPYAGFYCARVEGDLYLHSHRIPHTLDLHGSIINGSLVFPSSEWRGTFLASHSVISGNVDLSFAKLESLVARSATIYGIVYAEGVQTQDNFLLIGSDIYGGCCDDLKSAAVEAGAPQALDAARTTEIWLNQSQEIAYDQSKDDWIDAVDLHDAHIGGNLALSRARIRGHFNALRVDVGAGLYGQNALLGTVTLSQAKIAHDLFLEDSFFNWLRGYSISVGGDANLKRVVAETVNMLDAQVSDSALFSGAVIWNLSLERASVGRDVHLTKAGEGRLGDFGDVNLQDANIAQSLQLYDSVFHGSVDLKRAKVDQLLLFQSNRVPIWLTNSELNLDFVEARVLTARTPDSWLRFDDDAFGALINADTMRANSGACYYGFQRFDESEATNTGAFRAEQVVDCVTNEDTFQDFGTLPFTRKITERDEYDYVPMSMNGFVYQDIDERINPRDIADGSFEPFDVKAYIAWISRSGGFYNHNELSADGKLDATTFYSDHNPQPFQQLAAFFERRGDSFKADFIKIAQNIDRMAKTSFTPLGSLSLAIDGLRGLLTGFGVYPIVALGWFLLLVTRGAVVAGRPGSALHGKRWSLRFWYSMENALPLVSASQDFQTAQHADERVASFFHRQKILGFALASIFIGSLALL